MALNIEIIYCCPVPAAGPHYLELAYRFVASCLVFPGGVNHKLTVVSNGGEPTQEMEALFCNLPHFNRFLIHDNSGWDIGGFIAAAKQSTAEMVLCLGGPSHFRRAGWLMRMHQAWNKHGPSLYGSLATYEVRPHLNTSGFWCPPEMIANYPHPVTNRDERYAFEHGYNSLWLNAYRSNKTVLLVTWCGEYNWWHWRLPDNIYRRGDQSNCLTYFKHTDLFEQAGPIDRMGMARVADVITDPNFVINGSTGTFLKAA